MMAMHECGFKQAYASYSERVSSFATQLGVTADCSAFNLGQNGALAQPQQHHPQSASFPLCGELHII